MSTADDEGPESRNVPDSEDAGVAGGRGASAAAAPSPSSASSRPGHAGGTTSAAGTASGAGLVFDDPLSRPSADDSDRGWGDSSAASADDDFTRFLNEKPPHHL